MKSFAELQALAEKVKSEFENRDEVHKYRIVVGMATCGIAAGATPIFEALKKEAEGGDYPCVIKQTGCIGMCTLEPIVEIYDQNNEKITYVRMNPDKAIEVLKRHIKKDEIVVEYTVAAVNEGA